MAERMTRLRLRVSPGAKRSEVVGRHGEGWKVRVRAAPERGRANAAVVELLSASLALPRGSISILSGHTSADKIVEVRGLDSELVSRRLGGRA
jgi:uncharacterized protein YggU (UPF0235/DUF167 family)